jgi:CBS domain-containing protein
LFGEHSFMARLVSQVLIQRKFSAATPDTTVVQAAAKMKSERVGAILVMENRALVGIFTERDALFRVVASKLDPEATTLREVMTADVVSVAPDDDITHALRLMRDVGFRHLPVVEDGEVVGIISTRDIVTATEFSVLAGSMG